MGNFLDSALNILVPPLANSQDQDRTDKALAEQRAATQEAQGYMGENLDYLKGINQPLIQMGNEQLRALQSGINSGAFTMDESMFGGYQPYTASLYNAPDQFQYQDRSGFTPAPTYNYSQPGMSPLDYSRNTQAIPQFNPAMQPGGQWENSQFSGQRFMTGYDQYNAPQQPQMRDIPVQNQTPAYNDRGFQIGNDPVYNRRITEGNKAIEASAAAKGMQLSGQTLKALQQNASDIAAEEGAAAYGRYSQDRSFGADQNKESFLREQSVKETGRVLNNDEFSRWMSTDGQKYAQFADTRDWTTAQSNQNAARDWDQYTYEKGFGRDVYTGDRSFAQGSNLDNYNTALAGNQQYNQQFNQNFANNMDAYSVNQNQYNANRAYATDRGDTYANSLLNAYGINNQNFADDRAFSYGANQDFNTANRDAFMYNTATSQAESANQYQQLVDAYNRMGTQRTNQYGMIGDLANTGVGAIGNVTQGTSDYYGAMSDLAIGQANAAAAAAQAKNENTGLLSSLGL